MPDELVLFSNHFVMTQWDTKCWEKHCWTEGASVDHSRERCGSATEHTFQKLLHSLVTVVLERVQLFKFSVALNFL